MKPLNTVFSMNKKRFGEIYRKLMARRLKLTDYCLYTLDVPVWGWVGDALKHTKISNDSSWVLQVLFCNIPF